MNLQVDISYRPSLFSSMRKPEVSKITGSKHHDLKAVTNQLLSLKWPHLKFCCKKKYDIRIAVLKTALALSCVLTESIYLLSTSDVMGSAAKCRGKIVFAVVVVV